MSGATWPWRRRPVTATCFMDSILPKRRAGNAPEPCTAWPLVSGAHHDDLRRGYLQVLQKERLEIQNVGCRHGHRDRNEVELLGRKRRVGSCPRERAPGGRVAG